MKFLRYLLICIILIFAVIGMFFTGVFVAMQFGWLNVRGSIEARNTSMLAAAFSTNTAAIIDTLTITQPATRLATTTPDYSCNDAHTTCHWTATREWLVVAGGLQKDLPIITRVSAETGVPARLIAAVVVPEQIRFFSSNREVFKRYFEPLKILGSLSKFSLGVSGIKQETADDIERYAHDPQSEFYPGDGYAALIAYDSTEAHDQELFNRLTDEKDHYYSYLYTALFIKEIMAQWELAGYDITREADIVGTIFNIGFDGSRPNPAPQVGGTRISVGGIDYSFGEMAGLFYDSQLLPDLGK